MRPAHPTARPALTSLLIAAVTATTLSGCSDADGVRSTSDNPPRTTPADHRDDHRGVLTRAQAHRVLDHYEQTNNQANKTRNPRLLATVEAGQLYERSKAELAQIPALSAKQKKEYAEPFHFTRRSFHIPARGNSWFAAEATTSAGERTLMVFDKTPGRHWKRVHSLFPSRPMPSPNARRGIADTAGIHHKTGRLAPGEVTAAVEDLFTTGGKNLGRALSHTTGRAPRILTTHRTRGNHVAGQALVHFTPIRPAAKKTYALRTRSGVLAIVPLAHRQTFVVTRPELRMKPADKHEAIYDKRPRRAVTDLFQGEALVLLPPEGKPTILDYRYALVDSR
ncbi:hypothetical protein [Streptomyces spectabilis]|uniref:DUF8094 domain-containing protein n=1 Tax=Streptomyces spectabilis TaxID=68270 RepID=A0A7W8EY87_STRST|nr:hypothetical protein [Streptomyces spectabilis]MBB5109857.1 hypothetical protein [Streptomyces spectabilis]GGV55837.1 hypothetical protein GCM10010245_88570 [Streptomyces spectabilis]